MIKINEIFFSIQGESSYIGSPTVFIRTSGCHLRCHYCDTTYAYNEGQLMDLENILAEVKKYHSEYVCLTGGEPLLQKESFSLLKQLCDLGYKVSLETSGDIDCLKVDPRVKKIIDIKTPDSGEVKAFNPSNLNYKDVNTEYKFVLCSKKDFDWAENFCQKHHLFENALVLYSPSFRQMDERWLANKIIKKNSRARLQLQLHKYIWTGEERGV